MTLRQKIQFCTAHDGARIAYATTGRGAPLVKVGNWLSHLDFDLESPVWGHLLANLSQDHTVLRYDQRGTGLSDWSVDDISFEAWVNDLGTVIDAAGIERAPLLCISQGAPVAVAYAIRHPERVSHLVLHGAYARGRHKRGADPLLHQEAETIARLAEIGWGRDDPAFRQFFTSQFLPQGTVEQHRWFNQLARVSTSPTNAARMIRTFDLIDVSDVLPEVPCPTLVLHATGDLRVPFAEGQYIAERIPSARFVTLDSVHHLMLEDDPAWPLWYAQVRAFLNAGASAPSRLGFAALTPRERELLELIAQGRDNAQIAAVMNLSANTVRNHITNVFAKLEVENRAQAIVLARDSGFGQQL
jgi:pimeloyl-ACP methyl ester carboxylesterase/DNA-binding CsgD family transcriptional regulator